MRGQTSSPALLTSPGPGASCCGAAPGARRPPLRTAASHRCRLAAAAAAAGGPPADAGKGGGVPQQEEAGEFDIVSGRRLSQAEGASCEWPRAEQRRRWKEAALVTTGFPVPAGYGSASMPPAAGSGMLWTLRNPEREATPPTPATRAASAAAARRQAALRPGSSGGGRDGGGIGGGSLGPPLVPVFRASPYSAEAARTRRQSPTARILFLDDGCTCRAVLAHALLQAMLSKVPRPLDVEVHTASIGPPAPGGHDDRVVQVAREMDIPLPTRRAWEFDEMRDTVDYDLIVVMDRYDRQEVVMEVSVLERLNPGGAYLTRVHRLNHFARAAALVLKDRCLLVPDDLSDPFYGLTSAASELASLRRAVHSIALACRGLLSYLLKLRARCGNGTAAIPLRTALAQSLQCPLMDPSSHHAVSALIHCQLAPAQLALWQQQQGRAGGGGIGGSSGAASASGGTAASHAVDWTTHVSGWPRPIWVEPGGDEDDDNQEGMLWTVREVAGQTIVVRRPRPDDASGRRGYWRSITNVQRELSKWMELQGRQDRLPTQQELRRSGANTLSARVDSHGGLAVFAERMGLPLASGRAPNGTWADFANLAAELRRFVEEQQQPQQQELPAAGAGTGASPGEAGEQAAAGEEAAASEPTPAWDARLAGPAATGSAGGTVAPAAAGFELLGRRQQQEPQRHNQQQPWRVGLGRVAPAQQAAEAAGRQPAAAAPHGSSSIGSSSSGGTGRRNLRYASRSWSSSGSSMRYGPTDAMLLADDAAVTSSSDSDDASGSSSSSGGGGGTSSSGGSLVFLPTQLELRQGGRADLIGGIRQHGGSRAVARRLGWAVHHGRLPSEAAVVQQLLEFAQQQRQPQSPGGGARGGGTSAGASSSKSGAGSDASSRRGSSSGSGSGGSSRGAGIGSQTLLPMPTPRQLEEGGRVDLAGAVMRLGGVAAFGHLLESEQRRQQRQQRAQQELQQAEGQEGSPQLFQTTLNPKPQQQQQQERQREAASYILSYYSGGGGSGGGGSRWVAAAPSPPQPAVIRVGHAVVQLIKARGWEQRVPTKQELLAAGRRDLVAAIMRCGGSQKLAEHLQLPYTETRGRRKQGLRQQREQQLEGGQQQQVYLASRMRQPGGLALPVAAAGSSGAAASVSASLGALLPPGQQQQRHRPQGPASRLLEREQVLEAYQNVTFI